MREVKREPPKMEVRPMYVVACVCVCPVGCLLSFALCSGTEVVVNGNV